MFHLANKGKKAAGILILIIITIFSGCTNTEIGNPESFSLFAMNSDAELESYLRDQNTAEALPDKNDNSDIVTDEAPPESSIDFPEDGIDGAETVQDNEGYIYSARDYIIKVSKADGSFENPVIAYVNTAGKVKSLFLYKNILVAVQILTEIKSDSEISPQLNSGIRTGVLFLDITNPSMPEKINEIQIEGILAGSMLENGRLYVVQHYRPYINAGNKDDLMPSYAIIDDTGNPLMIEELLKPENVYRPAVPSGGMITAVTVFDPVDIFAPLQSIAFIGNVETVSLSSSAIYLHEASGSKIYKLDISGKKPVFSSAGNI